MAQFNVKNYGAIGDDVTNDTTSIQAAIEACYNAGGGDVYFPNGVYLLTGSLQTNVGGFNPNSQIYIPPILNMSNFPLRTHVRFIGETSPNFTANGVLASFTPSLKGTILKSTITGTGIAPAVIGGTDYTNTFGTNFVYTYLSIENITIIVKNQTNGPTVGGINGRDITSLQCNNVQVITDADYSSTTNIPTAEVAGIITAKNAGDGQNSLRTVAVAGFKYGIVLGEHCVLDQVGMGVCVYGLVYSGASHPTLGQRVSITWCKYFILFPNILILGMTQILQTRFRILELAGEIYITAGKWFQYAGMIQDLGGNGIGDITYSLFANGGAPADYNIINSGNTTGIIMRPLIGAMFPLYAITNISSNYTVKDTDYILIVTSTCTVTLSRANTRIGRSYVIKNYSSAAVVTVAAQSGDNIDSFSNLSLSAGQHGTAVALASGWTIIAN